MGDKVTNLTDGSVHEFLKDAGRIVVLKFWDPWCSICTEMAPVFEETAKRLHGKAIFAALNMRENPKAARDYDVYITPSFILLKGGKEVGRVGGLLKQEELELEIRRLL